MPIVIINNTKKLGFALANNYAIRAALPEKPEYFFLLNPDTKVDTECIEQLINFLTANREYGIAGSMQVEYASREWGEPNNWTKEVLAEASTLNNTPRAVSSHIVLDHYYVQGAAMMFRASLISQIGLLEPVYSTFYEETDFCRKCQYYGLKVGLVFDSKVKHYEGGNWKRSKKDNERRDFLFLRNQFIFFMSAPEGFTAKLRELSSILRWQINFNTLRKQ